MSGSISTTLPTESLQLTSKLLETATADFRAHLRHSRTHSLLVEYYVKRGLTADEIRQAVRNASTAPISPIRLVLPTQAAA